MSLFSKLDSLSRLTGKLLRGFQPVYPAALNIDLKTFCHAFPFHIVFDEQVQSIFAGC